MKRFKCTDCKRISEQDDKVVMVRCACGGAMQEVDSKDKPLQTLMNICQQNKCATCPLRDVECFGNY